MEDGKPNKKDTVINIFFSTIIVIDSVLTYWSQSPFLIIFGSTREGLKIFIY